jgi:Fe-S-cluster containining protein
MSVKRLNSPKTMNPTLNVLKSREALALDRIYARIPQIACQRRCQAACGKIAASVAENHLLIRQQNRIFGGVWTNEDEHHGTYGRVYCEFLSHPEGECTVYSLRPLMCRLFGVIRELACPHGCQPERWLSPEEQQELIREVNALG